MPIKNYGYGNTWLPGKIVAVHGSLRVTVKLTDGGSVRKHFDQLRSRVESHNTRPEEKREDLDSPEIPDTELPHSPAPDVGKQSPPPQRENVEVPQPSGSIDLDTADDTEPDEREVDPLAPVSRRSDRVRNPPDRFSHNVGYLFKECKVRREECKINTCY